MTGLLVPLPLYAVLVEVCKVSLKPPTAPMTQTMRRADIKLEKVVFCLVLLPGGRPVLAPERDGALARLPHDAPARDQPAEALAVGEGVARADGAAGAATREWTRQSLLGAGPRAPLHQLGLNTDSTFNAEKNNHQIFAGNRARQLL